MSQVDRKTAESELATFRKGIREEEWSDVNFLLEKAEELYDVNIELSHLILLRAKEIRPKGPVIIKRLKKYKGKLVNIASVVEPNTNKITTKVTQADVVNEQNVEAKKTSFLLNIRDFCKRPIVLTVLLPWLLFTIYIVVIATPRYESQMKVLVQQPDGMATMDASMAILSGLGVSSGNTDPQLVKAYIYSNDMLEYLEDKLEVKAHFSNENIDKFSRLSDDASKEVGFGYYQKQVQVEVDEASQIVSVYVRAFDPDYALLLSEEIVNRAEWYINSIGHQLANAQLQFIEGEHQRVENRLQEAKKRLLAFQQQYNLLDPEAEGAALSQITYTIESQIATTHAELRALQSTMSDQAPQVVMAQAKLDALYEQLNLERERLTEQRGGELSQSNPEGLSVSQLLARFTDYKVDLELALAAYTSSQVSLEKSRIEAYRQLKYLIKVESPTKPEENKYPQVIYNLALVAAVLLMLFGIGKIVVATVKELN